MDHDPADIEAVKNVLKKINTSWTQGDIAGLRTCLHDNMIIEGPDLLERKQGVGICIDHFSKIVRHLDGIKWREFGHQISIWHETALAKYQFEIEFQTSGEIRRESGYELYAFSREMGNWKAVWNFIVPHGQ